MRGKIVVLLLAVILPPWVLAQTGATSADAKARAQEVLKKARAALGDEAKLNALQSLSVSVGYRRVMGERETAGEMTYEFLFPSKFLRTDVFSPFPGLDITNTQVINGDRVWTDFQSSNPNMAQGAGRGGGGMMFGGPPGQNRDQAIQAEFGRLLLCWLLTTPSSLPVEFTYAGEAKSKDGMADAIDVTGPNNFKARLFFDQQSHRLLMLSYMTKQPPRMNFGRGPEAQGRPPEGRRPESELTPEERERLRAEREKRMKELQEAWAKAPDVEVRWFVSEFRDINGIWLPHRLVKSTGSQVNEEWEIKKVKINPKLKPEKFEKKEKS
jgi:hypothetical protein